MEKNGKVLSDLEFYNTNSMNNNTPSMVYYSTGLSIGPKKRKRRIKHNKEREELFHFLH
jgi:hypothetical protein